MAEKPTDNSFQHQRGYSDAPPSYNESMNAGAAVYQPNLKLLELKKMLESADLESYYDNFVEAGADSLKQLLDATDEELQEITDLVGMSSKKLHVKRLQKALQTWGTATCMVEKLPLESNEIHPKPSAPPMNNDQWAPLKEKITELEKKCEDGGTPFHYACENGQEDLAEIIMKNSVGLNIDLNAKTNDRNFRKNNGGRTAFHFACYKGHAKIAEMLIKNSAQFKIDLNAKDNGGRTAFHWACMNGYVQTAEIIIKNSVEFNIDLNAKNNVGMTAFHRACMYGQTSIVSIMINNSESFNLDLTARDNRGRTGFQLAKLQRNTEVVNMIRIKMPQIAF